MLDGLYVLPKSSSADVNNLLKQLFQVITVHLFQLSVSLTCVLLYLYLPSDLPLYLARSVPLCLAVSLCLPLVFLSCRNLAGSAPTPTSFGFTLSVIVVGKVIDERGGI